MIVDLGTREQSLGKVEHPVVLHGQLRRVDHPDLARLTAGEPLFGWEGDPRLAVYTDGTHYVLYRLEQDNTYRTVCVIQGRLGPDTVNALMMRLVQIDGRRGWDALATIEAEEAKKAQDRATNQLDWLHDWVDKFQFGLKQSHLPGIDIVRIRQAPTRG